MKVIMLGAPGAGKGTQAALIAEKYHIPHISTGDIFRANLKEGTELGMRAKAYMDKGELVPDDLTVEILLDRVSKDDCRDGYVLDGFPRTIPQAEVLKDALAKRGEKLDYAINIEVPDDAIVTRMSGRRSCPGCNAVYHIIYNPPGKEGVCDVCGEALVTRKDDEADTVRNRLKVYHDQTAPLIDYYSKEEVLRDVDGTQEMKDVTEAIFAILDGVQ